MEKGIKSRELKDRDQVRRAMVKKLYFPEPEIPSLVTMLEKDLMVKLHKEHKWTFDELSESFPVTPQIAKNIVKKQFLPRDPKLRAKHDEKVAKNWKFLSAGKLENSEELIKHLEENGLKIFSENRLSEQQKSELIGELEQDKLEKVPVLTGEFGQILLRHQNRQKETEMSKSGKGISHLHFYRVFCIRAGQYILILTIYIDIVNIYDIDIGIDIEFQPGTILILILTRVSISIYIEIDIDIEKALEAHCKLLLALYCQITVNLRYCFLKLQV